MLVGRANRRTFIVALGSAAAWPVMARAQERVKRPRVGFLMHLAPGDPDAMARVAGFLQGLQELGWATDRNIQIDYRWAVGQAELYRKYAAELVALQPDVLVTTVTDSVRALQRATQTIPIVFTSVIDPVGSGLITSLSHPGGNATGFSLFEFGIVENGWNFSNKLLRLSRELRFLGIAPRPEALDSLRLFKRMPLLSGWICFHSMRKKAAISTVLSALSPEGRAAALLSLQARLR